MFAKFLIAWAAIVAVVGFDTFLTVRNFDVMSQVEINPLAKRVLGPSSEPRNDVARLVALKTVGLGLAMALSFALWNNSRWRWCAQTDVYGVCALHLGLFFVLTEDSEHSAIVAEHQRSLRKEAHRQAAVRSDLPDSPSLDAARTQTVKSQSLLVRKGMLAKPSAAGEARTAELLALEPNSETPSSTLPSEFSRGL